MFIRNRFYWNKCGYPLWLLVGTNYIRELTNDIDASKTRK